MRRLAALIFGACLLSAWQPASAITIDSSYNAGAIPGVVGTGLSGRFYKSSQTFLTSLAQLNQLAVANVPSATFISNAICFPSCAGTSIVDSTPLAGLLNGNAYSISYLNLAAQTASTSYSGMIITGYIAIGAPGSYTFYLGSDDGSELILGGQTVINGDGVHNFTVASGVASFATAGLYPIAIEYFENAGNTGLELYAADSTGACVIGRAANCAAGTASTGLFYSSVPAIPEPRSLEIFGAALCGLAWARRSRQTTARL